MLEVHRVRCVLLDLTVDAVLGLRFVQIFQRAPIAVPHWSHSPLGSSLRKVYGVSAQLRLVKVVLTEIGLIASVAVWSAQVVGRAAVFEVVLLGCSQRSVSRGHISPHSLLVLKELGSCLVFVVLVLIS